MPAGVVVVKRARRRSFALLWAALAWLRSVASGWRRRPAAAPRLVRRGSRTLLFPALAPLASEPLSREAIGACLEACPDDCLSMTCEGGRVTRVRLDPGRCTGCGRTVDEWGQGLFVAQPAPPVFATVDGRLPAIDLLEDARS